MRRITLKTHRYELWEQDHGYGGPNDGSSKLIGRFASAEGVSKYLTKLGYICAYPDMKANPVLGCWWPSDGKNYLGLISYRVRRAESDFIFE